MRDQFDIWAERMLLKIGTAILWAFRIWWEALKESFRDLFDWWLPGSIPEKRKRKPALFPSQEDNILKAADAAVNHHIISSDELIEGIHLLAVLSDKGIKPHDIEEFLHEQSQDSNYRR